MKDLRYYGATGLTVTADIWTEGSTGAAWQADVPLAETPAGSGRYIADVPENELNNDLEVVYRSAGSIVGHELIPWRRGDRNTSVEVGSFAQKRLTLYGLDILETAEDSSALTVRATGAGSSGISVEATVTGMVVQGTQLPILLTSSGSNPGMMATNSAPPAACEVIGGISGSGVGARTVVITVTDGTDPIASAIVRLTAGTNSYSAQTATDGTATFNLDDGTYTVAATKAGYSYSGSTLAVTGDAAATLEMTPLAIEPPAAPGLTRAFCVACDSAGQPTAGIQIRFRMTAPPAGEDAVSFYGGWIGAVSEAAGLLQINLVKGATYAAVRGGGDEVTFTAPTDDTYALPATLSGERGGAR